MFKKLMLILGLCSLVPVDTIQARNNDNNNTAIVVMAVTVAAVGTGLYWSMRESNDVKIARVDELQICYGKEMRARLSEIAALQDVQVFMIRVPEFEREMNNFDARVQNSYNEISNRYNAWLTPWNNNVSMHRAYTTISDLRAQWSMDLRLVQEKMHDMAERMTSFQAIAYFSSVLASWNFSTEEKDVIKVARKICQGNSLYPMYDAHEKLKNALAAIYKTHQHVPCDHILMDKMEQLKMEILSSGAYLDETRIRKEEQRAQEEFELKKRLADVEERKVLAEEIKAQAATEQAKSQKNKNRIARDRNRIERVRTGQDSFWYNLCDLVEGWSD